MGKSRQLIVDRLDRNGSGTACSGTMIAVERVITGDARFLINQLNRIVRAYRDALPAANAYIGINFRCYSSL